MITAAMKEQLRASGHTDEAIFNMTPAEAQEALGGSFNSPQSPPITNGSGEHQPYNGGGSPVAPGPSPPPPVPPGGSSHYGHLWSRLPETARSTPPRAGEDIKDWLEERGGDPSTLLDICREIHIKGHEIEEIDAGELVSGPKPKCRQWLIRRYFCRKYVSSVASPGGVGKTTLRLTQAIEVALGRQLLDQHIYRQERVLMLSFEDDVEELHRRLLAICRRHEINPAELKDRLFIQALRKTKLARAGKKNGEPVVGELDGMVRRAVKHRAYGLVIFDPFVRVHTLQENVNEQMDFVSELLVDLSHELNIAVDVPAHTHKGKIAAGDQDARRGASAQANSDRIDYTLTVMSEDEAEQFGIEDRDRKTYVRLDNAKVNLVRQMQASWFRLVSVNLDNADEVYTDGDEVQAIECWTPPETWEGTDAVLINAILDDIAGKLANGQRYSNHGSAKDRAAWKVVQFHCPTKAPAACKEMIKHWLKTGVLFNDEYDDPVHRDKRQGLFVDDSKRPKIKAAETVEEDG
jgi:hypothetical protein